MQTQQIQQPLPKLVPGSKEYEIASRLCHGEDQKFIASEMGISIQLVKYYIGKLHETYKANNSTHLVAILLTCGAFEK